MGFYSAEVDLFPRYFVCVLFEKCLHGVKNRWKNHFNVRSPVSIEK